MLAYQTLATTCEWAEAEVQSVKTRVSQRRDEGIAEERQYRLNKKIRSSKAPFKLPRLDGVTILTKTRADSARTVRTHSPYNDHLCRQPKRRYGQ